MVLYSHYLNVKLIKNKGVLFAKKGHNPLTLYKSIDMAGHMLDGLYLKLSTYEIDEEENMVASLKAIYSCKMF